MRLTAVAAGDQSGAVRREGDHVDVVIGFEREHDIAGFHIEQ